MADDNKTYEPCPFCDEEVALDAELKVQTCPNCGKRIVTCSMCRACDTEGDYCTHCCLNYQARVENEEKEDISELTTKFGERHGFGATGFPLDSITAWLNERIPNKEVRINLPYYDFNVRGKVKDVHRDVHGVMPMTYLSGHKDECVEVEDTTTLYYGNERVSRGNYLPFLSECDVYYVTGYTETSDGEMVLINVKKGPCWREYL
jgi:predicted RNA-binding Zn-ribbon protein involved in translation (DUF1610 family)